MNFVYIGKIINTHGIKGELRLISNFERKNIVFKENFILYIGNSKIKVSINSYRRHKNYDMLTFKGYNNINEVITYKGEKVYINKDDLNLKASDYLLSDLIGFTITKNNISYGIVETIMEFPHNTLLKINYHKSYYIPYVSDFIKKVNLEEKKIEVERVEELL